MEKKNLNFFRRCRLDICEHGSKSTQMRLLGYVGQNFFFSKNQSGSCCLQYFWPPKKFHEDLMNFRTKRFKSVLTLLGGRRTKSTKFSPKLGLKSLHFGSYTNFVWGIRKKCSRDDLLTPQIPGREVYPDNHS